MINSKNTKYAAGAGQKGTSLAPLGAMAIEEQAKELGPVTTHKSFVKVCPMVDGTWYCPDCGELNKKGSNFCKGCERIIYKDKRELQHHNRAVIMVLQFFCRLIP